MRRVTAVLLLAGTLAGCASANGSQSPWLVQRDLSPPRNCEPLTADQELVLGLSQEMATARRWHAALANLERLPGDVPQVRLSKARLLRLLGHSSEAEVLYGSLLQSCLMADARHGLGQIEASQHNYAKAQEHLRVAASQSPANESIRNDLGVVYLNQRLLAEARFELLTAMELNENSKRAAQNMLTLLVYEGNWQGAQQLVSARGLSSDDFKRAEQRAQSMRSEDASVPTPMSVVATRPLATPEPAGTAVAVASMAAPVAPAPRVQSITTVPAAAPTSARSAVIAPTRAPVPVSEAAVALPVRTAVAPAPAPVSAPVPVSAVAPAPVHVSEVVAAPTRTVAPMSVAVAARVWAAEEAAQGDGAANQSREVQRASSADALPIVCRPSGSSVSPRSVMECLPNEE